MEAKERLNSMYNYYNTNASKIEGIVKENNSQSKFSKQTLYNIEKGLTQTISNNLAEILTEIYPDISFVWLTTGKGAMLNERPAIINSNVANNVKGNVSQSVDAENERLRLENAMLKQRVGDLESRIEQYKETIDILKGVINK